MLSWIIFKRSIWRSMYTFVTQIFQFSWQWQAFKPVLDIWYSEKVGTRYLMTSISVHYHIYCIFQNTIIFTLITSMQKINVSIYSYSVASNQFSKNVREETKKMRELPYPASSCLPLNITSSQVLAPCHFALQTEQNWSPHCKHTKQRCTFNGGIKHKITQQHYNLSLLFGKPKIAKIILTSKIKNLLPCNTVHYWQEYILTCSGKHLFGKLLISK